MISRLAIVLGICVAVKAFADQYDETRRRAQCAHVEMAEALGEPVSPTEKKACEALPKKPVPPPQKKKEEPFSDVREEQVPQLKEVQEKPKRPQPDWIQGKPAEGDVVYGVGIVQKNEVSEARRLLVAMQRALAQIGAQIEAQVASQSKSLEAEFGMREQTGKKTKDTSIGFTSLSDATRLVVTQSLEDARLVDTWEDTATGTFYALVALDMGKVAQKQQAIVRSVLEALTQATQRAAQALTSGEFSQGLLVDLLDALDYADAMGRTKLGKKVKHEWQAQYKDLAKMAKKLAGCLRVEGKVSDGVLTFSVFCGNTPIRDGRFQWTITGGLVDLPSVLTTDSEGKGKVEVGDVFGAETVKVALMHDVSESRGAWIVKGLSPSSDAVLALRATSRLNAKVNLAAPELSGKGLEAIKDAIRVWASRRWGAQIVDGDARVTINCAVNLGSKAEVYGKVSVPVEVTVSVVGPRGTLFETTQRQAGLADTEVMAKEEAVKRAVTLIQSL